jgi:4-hydroxybenzoate polyprenyltransferase
MPDTQLIVIFSVGTILMRSAGCAINDFADRDFDRHVKRTAERPLTSGQLHAWEAVAIAVIFALVSFALILPLNVLTRELSVLAVLVAGSYPYFKRFFALPQAYLGIAFGFGIPMAYAAVLNNVPTEAWVLLIANVFWALAYDTEYAMVDRDDDLKIGIRTSAITFGKHDVGAVMLSYTISLCLITAVGIAAGLGKGFAAGMVVATIIAGYHWTLIRHRERDGCFAAFRHNNWLGAAIFVGIVLG